jgi:catechol 2,3-dioxygenase-like lactoylglutathione lyase family enzyme
VGLPRRRSHVSDAGTSARRRSACQSLGVSEFLDAAPVLVARDLDEALERYRRLGFEVSAYTDPGGGSGYYGYARRDAIQLHLAHVHDLDPRTNLVAAYLYVDDADAVYDAWTAAGVQGRFHPPSDTDYGLREAAYVDPDGNLLRFGSWLPGHGPTPD